MTNEWFYNPYAKTFFIDMANQVLEFNAIGGKTPQTANRQLCLSLNKEEFAEAKEAYEQRDKVAFLGEIIDCFVVSSFGLQASHISTYINDVVYQSRPRQARILETLELDNKNLFNSSLYLMDASMGILKGIDADWKGAMKEKLASNMSKFSKYDVRDEDKYDLHSLSLMKDGRYNGVTWNVNDGWVVWKSDKGKILKGRDYFEAQLDKYVEDK